MVERQQVAEEVVSDVELDASRRADDKPTNREERQEHDDGVVVIRGGIAVVPRDGVVPDNYTL